ncbi:ammonium transporter 2 [Actinidia rufa]|uniref:Ammonium transporter 2 n=1 Tax=Actinidia rufa TaxID=165716 RepID=A0A7J0GS16_9ERIC|nr:ammonium transporter 2 [Actinidia rufa]
MVCEIYELYFGVVFNLPNVIFTKGVEHHADSDYVGVPRADEFCGVDCVCTAVDDLLVHGGGIQHLVPRWVVVGAKSGGFVIHLSSGVAGFTAAYWGEQRPGEVPAQQYPADGARGGATVDGMDGIQRWGPMRDKHSRVSGRPQHPPVHPTILLTRLILDILSPPSSGPPKA